MPLDNMPTVAEGDTANSADHNTVVANTEHLADRLSAQGGSGSRIRFRAVRRQPGNATTGRGDQVVWWVGSDVQAQGVSLVSDRWVRITTPGMYVVTTTITLAGTVSSGTRLMLHLSSPNNIVRFAISNYPLPATNPQVQVTGLVPVGDETVDVGAWMWTNSTATSTFDVSGAGNVFTVAYLGGI